MTRMIDQIRGVWHSRTETQAAANAAEPGFGGRVADKRVPWAIERVRSVLERFGRRPFALAEPGAPIGPAEQSLLTILEAIRTEDAERARLHAAWLVRADAIDRLLRALAPVAEAPALRARAA